jgi:iron complex outermembrane receptor protein
MQQKHFCERKALRFKHFSRKGYALFSVMGREVLIGTLSVATLSHAKADGISINVEATGDSLQRSELKLDEVVVTGSRAPLTLAESAKIVSVITRDDIHRAAAESINDILKLATGVDVRQRGGFGVQTDISVRGGNFDQITILLNGVNISSPHTGHLSADFPISPEDIERIEVLEGPAARVYGTSAFNGVINIVTRTGQTLSPLSLHRERAGEQHGGIPSPPMQGDLGGLFHLSAGQYGYANGNMCLVKTLASTHHLLSGGYTRTDGATPNSYFSSSRVFYHGSAQIGNATTVSGQLGYSYKPYAANTFYGASSTDQWESNERLMAALNADIKLGAVHLAPQLYWNRWFDHYQWHKDNPAGENFHKVDSRGASLNAWFSSPLGKTSLGLEVRGEGIKSTKLGKPMPESDWEKTGGHDAESDKLYKYKDTRTNISAFLEHDILLQDLTLSLGLLANMNDGLDTRWRVYPGIDISYRPSDAWKLFASWNMALRMPTFTDLYYSGANIEGNSNLKPEKTTDYQLGAQYRANGFMAEAQLFYSHKTDMIDWVTYSDTQHPSPDTYRSVNFLLNNKGFELNLQLLPQELWSEACPLRKLTAKYSYINEDSEYDVAVISSKYAMDYLRHKVVMTADGRLWKRLSLSLSWRWQDRIGRDNPSYAITDSRLSWDVPKWSVYFDVSNLFNKKYYDYSTIPQPGLWWRIGTVIKFGL